MHKVRMRKPIIVLVYAALLIFPGCSLLRPVDALEKEATAAYRAGNKEEALAAYERLIDVREKGGEQAEGIAYQRAGLLAFDLDDMRKAIDYLEVARHTTAGNAQTVAALAKAYRVIDNLSREIRMLELYVTQYPGEEEYVSLQRRLFITLVESLNFQQACELWPRLEADTEKDEELLTGYLFTLQALNEETKAVSFAEQILILNEDNVHALELLAKKHFHRAEVRYREEMSAYEQNRTHRQYARLLDALEIINSDLRTALRYFKRLYEQEPVPEYARYLANIYERFQDEERAGYYRRRAQ